MYGIEELQKISVTKGRTPKEFRKRRYTELIKLVPTLTKNKDYERYAKRGYTE